MNKVDPALLNILIKDGRASFADIARQLRFGDGVAAGIHSLDEHWNGGGRPARLMRFRREVVLERPAPGVRLGATRRASLV